MDRESITGYRGLAYILWGSWRIEGQAVIDDGTATGPEVDGLAGTFVADSETEPILLTSLAAALHESYSLRLGEEEEHHELIDIAIVGHDGNHISFALRG